MMRILLAAGLAWLGIGLAGLSAACDSEPRQSAEADAELLDAMIGQMIMVGFDGRSERDPGVIAVRDQLAKGTSGALCFTRAISGRRRASAP